MSTQEVIQKHKSKLWCFKLTNWLLDYPSFKNNVLFKAAFRAYIEFYKDELSEVTEKGNCLYKKIDEIDEQQLDGNQREIKNILGEILEEANLFYKKFDEDEEGENEKKLKNTIIELLKLTQAFCQILDETLEEQKLARPERYPAEEPGC